MTSSRFTALLLSLLLSSIALVGDTPEEGIQIWQPGLRRFIKNKRTVQKAQEEGFGYVSLDGKLVFFKNENDFKQWVNIKVKDEDQTNTRLRYFSQKLDVVRACLNNIPDKEKTAMVAYDFRQCGGYFGNPVKYMLSLKDNFVTIDLRLELIYKGLPENMARVKSAISDVQPCIKKMMANQGIQFNLIYGYADEGGLKDRYATVAIYDIRPGKSNAAEWSVLSSQGSAESLNRICTMMAHEMLHLLGLGDTYARPNCPQREPGKPNEIMANSSVLPEAAKLTELEYLGNCSPVGQHKPRFVSRKAGF